MTHARTCRIDTSRAAALPGVKAIVTLGLPDLPEIAPGYEQSGEMPISFRDLVRQHLRQAKRRSPTAGTRSRPWRRPAPHVAEERLEALSTSSTSCSRR